MSPKISVLDISLCLACGLLLLCNISVTAHTGAPSDVTSRKHFIEMEKEWLEDLFVKMRKGSLSDAVGGAFYWQDGEGGSLSILDLYRTIQVLAELTVKEFDLDIAIPEGDAWDASPILQQIRNELQSKGKILLHATEASPDTRRATLLCYAIADVKLFAELPPLEGLSLNGKPFSHTKPIKVYALGEIFPHRRYAYHYADASGSLLIDGQDVRNSCILVNPDVIEANLRRYGLMNTHNVKEQFYAVLYNEVAHFYSMTEMGEVFNPKSFRKSVFVTIKNRRMPVTIHQINELYSELVTLRHSRPHPAIYFSGRMINTRAEQYRLIHIVTSSAFSRVLSQLENTQPGVFKKLLKIAREFKRIDRESGRQEDADDAIRELAQLVENNPWLSESLLTCLREETEKLFQVCWREVSILLEPGSAQGREMSQPE